MRRVLLAMALTAGRVAALAQDPASLEPVAERYRQAETYCEAGKWGMRTEPQHGFQDTAFSGCAHRDGRMKYVEHVDRDRQVYTWVDAGRFYRYSEYGDFYKEFSDRDFPTHWGYRREPLPALTSRIFAWDSEHLAGRDPLKALGAYKAKPALSTAERAAFERFNDPHERSAERVFLSSRDRTLVRYEQLRDGVVMRYVEVTPQLGRPLSAADLAHQAPLATRYSLGNNQPVFFAGLFAVAILAGAAVWAAIFARAADLGRVLRGRRRLWLIQLWALGGTAVALAALAIATVISPGHGHPPAIVLVYVLGLWAAVAFALAACFTLASYPVQLLLARRR